jgi:AraC family transcriptional regulator, L-rhamnose operon transcriptional activator RhaR
MSNHPQLGGHVTSKIFPIEHTPILAREWLHEGDDLTHDHTFMEIAVVLEGSAVHRTIYGDQPIGPGDVFVLLPGAWHGYVQSQHLLIYNLLVGQEILQRELSWTKEDPLMSHLLWTGPATAERRGILRLRFDRPKLRRVRRLLQLVGRSTQVRTDANRAEQIGRLLLFLASLAQEVNPAEIATRTPRPPHWAVMRGVRLLEEQLATPWTLAMLSEELNVDESYLVRLFKSATGLSPIAYLARARAERAAVMLLRTDQPIADIATAVGWDDPNYFARRFKAHFQLTASEYRRKYGPGGKVRSGSSQRRDRSAILTG